MNCSNIKCWKAILKRKVRDYYMQIFEKHFLSFKKGKLLQKSYRKVTEKLQKLQKSYRKCYRKVVIPLAEYASHYIRDFNFIGGKCERLVCAAKLPVS